MKGWLLAVSLLLVADVSAASVPLVPGDSTGRTVSDSSAAKPDTASSEVKQQPAPSATKPEAAMPSSEAKESDAALKTKAADAAPSKETKSTHPAKPSAAKPAAAAHHEALKKDDTAHSGSTPADVLPDMTHERVDYWVTHFSKDHDYHRKIAAGFVRKAHYQTMIERKLRKRGMPQNLIYLAMEESAFNSVACSRRKAAGIWQLTPATARLYGLKVKGKTDERRNVEKETDAALAFLSHLHKRFGCWYLAAAAYDSGENRVARIMHKNFRRDQGRDRDYYRIWNKLPGETRDYVPAIIALKRIGTDPAKYGF
jgi:soluble lytic murein transglycosylase-like protein